MFFIWEVFCSLGRRKGFCALTIAASGLLFGFLGFYMGNFKDNQQTLEKLGRTIPIPVKITNANGSEDIGLEISAAHMDALAEGGVKDLVCTAQAGANRDPSLDEARIYECDTSVRAANSLEAFAGLEEREFDFQQGYDSGYLSGKEPYCTISASYGRLYGILAGDTLELSVYQMRYTGDSGSFQFLFTGRTSLKVIGTYVKKEGEMQDVLVPVSWLRAYTQEQGKNFYYDSARAVLEDGFTLNAFKESMDRSFFSEVDRDVIGGKRGSALSVQDQIFIETAEKIQGNLELYRRFQAPFFLLIYGVSVLLPQLLLRNRKKEAAIALSLGRSRFLTGLELFAENLLLGITGCVPMFVLLICIFQIPAGDLLSILGIFIGCFSLGTCTALGFFLHFDVMELLVKMD